MRIAVLSDIHGNLEAFQQVLADMDQQRLEAVICLGDSIGYGPDPEAVVSEISRRELPAIVGNHEMAVFDRMHLNWFNPMARLSLERTIEILSETSINYIKTLPYSRVMCDARFVHGYPPESARTYLFRKSDYELKKTMNAMTEPICFVGHTHELEIIKYNGSQMERGALTKGITKLNPQYRYILNIGSVGQPRDGTNHAKYAIWNIEDRYVEVRFVAYDIETTVNKIKAAGLPAVHANRLW